MRVLKEAIVVVVAVFVSSFALIAIHRSGLFLEFSTLKLFGYANHNRSISNVCIAMWVSLLVLQSPIGKVWAWITPIERPNVVETFVIMALCFILALELAGAFFISIDPVWMKEAFLAFSITGIIFVVVATAFHLVLFQTIFPKTPEELQLSIQEIEKNSSDFMGRNIFAFLVSPIVCHVLITSYTTINVFSKGISPLGYELIWHTIPTPVFAIVEILTCAILFYLIRPVVRMLAFGKLSFIALQIVSYALGYILFLSHGLLYIDGWGELVQIGPFTLHAMTWGIVISWLAAAAASVVFGLLRKDESDSPKQEMQKFSEAF